MSYCREHGTNSPCVACELRKQTREIVAAIRATQAPELPPTTWQKFKHRIGLLFAKKAKKAI